MKLIVFAVISVLCFSGSNGFFLPIFNGALHDDSSMDYFNDWVEWLNDDSSGAAQDVDVQVVKKNVEVVCNNCHILVKCNNCTTEFIKDKEDKEDKDKVKPELGDKTEAMTDTKPAVLEKEDLAAASEDSTTPNSSTTDVEISTEVNTEASSTTPPAADNN